MDRKLAFKIDVGDLAERVHTGIGAAGAANVDAGSGELFDGVDQPALHGWPVRLDLPAEKRRSVVFECQAIAGHGCE